MKDFPLYDTLQDVVDKDLTLQQKNEFIKKIQTFNDKGFELLYMLIKVHYIKNTDSNDIPYSGKYISETYIEFNIEEFPNRLKQIIYKFMRLHLKTMNEEKMLSSK